MRRPQIDLSLLSRFEHANLLMPGNPDGMTCDPATVSGSLPPQPLPFQMGYGTYPMVSGFTSVDTAKFIESDPISPTCWNGSSQSL